jgi:hypothetical protein
LNFGKNVSSLSSLSLLIQYYLLRALERFTREHKIRLSFLGCYIAEHSDRVPERERDSTVQAKLLVELVGLFMRSKLIDENAFLPL